MPKSYRKYSQSSGVQARMKPSADIVWMNSSSERRISAWSPKQARFVM